MAKDHELVKIHIDKELYESPSQTTGVALYTLGKVKPGYVLFHEVQGHGDDPPVANDGTAIEVKNGDHFYSSKDELNPGQ